jgi:hypothetical protein
MPSLSNPLPTFPPDCQPANSLTWLHQCQAEHPQTQHVFVSAPTWLLATTLKIYSWLCILSTTHHTTIQHGSCRHFLAYPQFYIPIFPGPNSLIMTASLFHLLMPSVFTIHDKSVVTNFFISTLFQIFMTIPKLHHFALLYQIYPTILLHIQACAKSSQHHLWWLPIPNLGHHAFSGKQRHPLSQLLTQAYWQEETQY